MLCHAGKEPNHQLLVGLAMEKGLGPFPWMGTNLNFQFYASMDFGEL